MTNTVLGLVERTGVFWVNNLPLNSGTNVVTLWVTNAAGFGSMTNFSVSQSSMTLVLTSISGDLWLPTVNVGGIISDLSAPIWVNGVLGTNNGDGTWSATDVPVSAGGVASFDMTTVPTNAPDPNNNTNMDKVDEVLTKTATWGTAYVIADEYGNVHEANVGKGQYSLQSGGTYTMNQTVWDTNGLLAQTEDTVVTLASDWSIPVAVTVFTVYTAGVLDYMSTTTNYGGSFTPPNEEGSLSLQDGSIENESHSTVKRVYQMGGTGSDGQQVLVAAAATPIEETGTEPFANKSLDGHELTLGVVGQALIQSDTVWAYQLMSAASSPPITANAGVPMITFNPDTGENFALIHLTECTAPGNTNNARTTIGIGELVDLSFTNGSPGPTGWSVSGGGTISPIGDSGAVFTASMSPSTSIVTVTNGTATKSVTFDVIAPSGVTISVFSNTPTYYGTNEIGAQTFYQMQWISTNVSFVNAQFQEDFPQSPVRHWPNGTNTQTQAQIDPLAGNGDGCSSQFADAQIAGLRPIGTLYNGTNYVDFSYATSWTNEYQNQSGQWIPFATMSRTTQYRGSDQACQIILNGVSGSWQGPWP